MVVARK